MKTNTDPAQVTSAKPAETPAAKPAATDFADDQLKGREERAKAAYKSGIQSKVVGEIGSRLASG